MRYATAVLRLTASANASSSTATLSSMASSVITSGGAILTVPPPKPTGREHQHAFFDRSAAPRPRPGRHPAPSCPGSTQATPATRPLPSTDADLREPRLAIARSRWCRTSPTARAFSARFSFSTRSMEASAAAQQTGLPVCVEVMLPGGCRSITSGRPATADSGSELEMPLPNARQVRHDAVMLEAPHRAGAAEARLHFVAHQQRLVPGAPLAQRLHVFRRRERGAAALIGFQDHAGHVLRLDVVLAQARARKPRRKCRACGSRPGNGTCTKPGSRLTIHSFSAGMPPACCEPSVRPWNALS